MNKEFRIRIEQDCSPESPREWGNLGTMVCWHDRYSLGDEQPSCGPREWALQLAEEFEPGIEERVERFAERLENSTDAVTDKEWLEFARQINEYQDVAVDEVLDRHVIMLPLYLMDHGNITMNTGGFHCPWDSGQVGWIWVSKAKVREEFGWKLITGKRAKQVECLLKAEVAIYAEYLEGDVHGFILESRPSEDAEWEHEDSCWGFYGSDPFKNGMADYIDEEHHELLKEVA